jgi:hypothetical protein
MPPNQSARPIPPALWPGKNRTAMQQIPDVVNEMFDTLVAIDRSLLQRL